MSEWSDETVVVDGHHLHYVTAGDPGDPPLVLLHGGIIDAAHVSWGAVVDPLAADYRVVAPDLLGYGRSAKPDLTYSLSTHVDVVGEFLDVVDEENPAVDLDAPTLVGISMGGGVALGVALRTPAAVDRVVCLDSYGLGRELANGRLTYLLSQVGVFNRLAVALFCRSRRLTKASLGGIVHDLDALSSEAVDAVWEETRQPGAGKAFRSFRAAEVTREGYRTDFSDRLTGLSMPALFLHGEYDELFPPAWSKRAADRAPEGKYRTLADCAHWAPRERPDAVVERIREFVP